MIIGSRLCPVCLTKFNYSDRHRNKIFCHKKCSNIQKGIDQKIENMSPRKFKNMLNAPNRTMFVGSYAEGEVL